MSEDERWPRASAWLASKDAQRRPDLAIVGVPASRTSISPTDAHTTPVAIRAALHRFSTWATTIGTDVSALAVHDHGDLPDPDSDEPATTRAVADALKQAELLIALGGDNSITHAVGLGVFDGRLDTAGLITFDAHHDLRDGVSNGSPVRRLVEAGLDGRRVVQIGIADFANSAEYAARARDLGITVVTRLDVANRRLHEVVSEALGIAGAGGGPIHVDLDVDVCDQSVAPACPASLPGGLSATELRLAARLCAAHPRVRGLDVTEVDAARDSEDQRTVRLAALLVLEAAAGLAARLA